MSKKKAVFVCVHNSCRSQFAEALGNHLVGGYEALAYAAEKRLRQMYGEISRHLHRKKRGSGIAVLWRVIQTQNCRREIIREDRVYACGGRVLDGL